MEFENIVIQADAAVTELEVNEERGQDVVQKVTLIWYDYPNVDKRAFSKNEFEAFNQAYFTCYDQCV